MRNGSKRTRQATFFCFPLFFSKLKSISCFGFSDLNLASLCSFLELIGELVRWSLLVAFSPPPSAMFLNCALLAFPTVRCLVWRRGKGRREGAGGMECQLRMSLRNGSFLSTLSHSYFFFPVKNFPPLFFHKACWKQLATN